MEEKHLPKLQEYENHLKILGDARNSYSKTDPAATFMRMKDDHMGNGQLKPAYNVQIATENQFITNFGFFSARTDFSTFLPFNHSFKERYNKLPKKEITDAGYGSEENYEYMEINEIEPFVKYPGFHAEQKKSFKNNIFIAQNLFYNQEKDYFVCPMGQQMENVGNSTRKSGNGYISTITYYEAKNCSGCPLKCLCHNAKENRRIEVNHKLNQYRQKARELLTSREGKRHRKRRSIEPEAVFGQAKANKQYNRFRHFGWDGFVVCPARARKPRDNQHQLDFMEIIEDRHARKATIIASQLPVANWFDLFKEETLADAILDRIVHTSHRFELKGESLRKK